IMIRSSLTPSEPVIVNCDAKLLMSVRPLAGTNGKASSHDPIAAGMARSPPCTTLIPCAVSEPGSDLQLQSLASFFLGALFQCRFARKLYAALVVDADAFDGFPAGPDQRTDFLGINLDRLNAGRVFR